MTRLLLPVFFALCGCMAKTGIRYEYADGSGNLYRLSQNHLEYIPVQPAESSSGIYSGGKPVKKILTDADYEKISQQFQTAIDNQAVHIAKRLMGLGMVLVRDTQQTRTILLSPTALEKSALESLLKAAKDQNLSSPSD